MKNILIIFLSTFTLFLNSCKKEPVKNIIVSMQVNLAYKNVLGVDLLNTASQNHFFADSIHVFNLHKGLKTERYYPNLDNPKLWSIFKIDSLNTCFLGIGVEVDTTLITLNKSITDTLICSIDSLNGNHIITRVCYNGSLKWNDINLAREFIIIK